MPEAGPLDAEGAPEGPVRYAWFGGILEGRVDDPARMNELVHKLNRLGVANAELEVEGGRFSLMLDDAKVPGERLTEETVTLFTGLLDELVRASGHASEAESTLHCTSVYARSVVETLFQVEDGGVRPYSRTRPLADADALEKQARVADALRRVGLRRAAAIGALLLVAFGLVAWQSGYLDRVFAHSAEKIDLDTGPFGKSLALSVEKSWGDYAVTIRRGPEYPAGPEEIERRRAAAADLVQRAALDILAGGGRVYVQLRNADGKVLETVSVELRPLLGGPEAEVEAKVRGRISAYAVHLSLERGKP